MKLKLVGLYEYNEVKKFNLYQDEQGVQYLEKLTNINNYEILHTIASISQTTQNLLEIVAFKKQNETTLHYFTEFIQGKTLEQSIKAKTKWDEEKIRQIIYEVCLAVKALHDNGILHRDIKPANIMVSDTGIVKLIDYDISRKFSVGTSFDTTQYGTRGYAPPEQYGFSQTDFRSDLYSLGITIEELITNCCNTSLYNSKHLISSMTQINPKLRINNIEEVIKALNKEHPDFFPSQLNQIEKGLNLGLSNEQVNIYAKKELNANQMGVIKNCLLENIDLDIIELLNNQDFTSKQMWQIKRGSIDGLAITQIKNYAKPFYTNDEMALFRYGLINDLSRLEIYENIKYYKMFILKNKFSLEQIKIIKFIFLKGVNCATINNICKGYTNPEQIIKKLKENYEY